MSGRHYVVLDRDGTIIEERNYIGDPAEAKVLPGACEGIRRLRELGLGVIVVSNQSGVGRGFFDMDAVRRVNTRMQEMLAEEGAAVDAIYVCPHAPDAGCGCRKPAAGLVQDAAKKHGFALSDLFIIGDNVCDVELGKKAGAVTILVRTGYGARVEAEGSCDPDYIVDDLPGAALVIERILRINAPVGEEVMGS